MSEHKVGDTVESLTKIYGYHSQGHVFFRRLESGNVELEVWSLSTPWTLLSKQTFEYHIWASILASMSWQGEDTHSYQNAIAFHTGQTK